MTTIKLSEVLSPAFKDVHQAVKDGRYDQFVLKGGRGSAKSSFVSVEVILQLDDDILWLAKEDKLGKTLQDLSLKTRERASKKE